MDKDPTSYQLLTYFWVMGISLWSGTAAYIRRVRAMNAPRYSIVEWIGELVVSGLIGVATFYLCEWASFDPLLGAVIIAISAGMGNRIIPWAEDALIAHLDRKTKKD